MKNRSKSQKIALWVVFVIFLVYAVSLIYPFFWLIVNSFKDSHEFSYNIYNFPDQWVMKNYIDAFKLTVSGFSLLDMFANSLFIVAVAVVISLFISACSAYVLSKFRFKGSRLIYNVAIAVMLIPTTGALSATYKLMHVLGLFGTRLGLFVMYSGGFGFSFLMLYNYFANVSWNYAEAAMVDGAKNFTVFFRVMLPQAKAPMGALAILSSINYWNDFFGPFMYLKNKPTVAVGLEILSSSTGSNYPALFAAMVLSIIPIFIVFIIFNKTIMESSLAGGLKG